MNKIIVDIDSEAENYSPFTILGIFLVLSAFGIFFGLNSNQNIEVYKCFYLKKLIDQIEKSS